VVLDIVVAAEFAVLAKAGAAAQASVAQQAVANSFSALRKAELITDAVPFEACLA
jgi:hypothetical protein